MRRSVALLAAILLLCLGGKAQNRSITGTVTDAKDGSPLPGVTVSFGNTGTHTNGEGAFTISLPDNANTLTFSFVGYASQTVAVAGQKVLNIKLATSESSLEEVIIVAYGSVKKGEYTGSAAQINAKEIEKRPIMNVANALVGSAPGIQTTSAGGAPGSSPAIRLRGFGSISASSSPLIVLDGAVYDGGLANINPDDVESISTLKDASTTALYGARGGNGVIMITTKKGKRNRNTLSFKATQGVTSRGMPEYDRTSAAEWYPLMWQSYRNNLVYAASNAVPIAIANELATGTYPRIATGANAGRQLYNNRAYADISQLMGYNPYNVASNAIVLPNGELNPNAQLLYAGDLDWQKAFLGKGHRQDYQISYSGGGEKNDYYASMAYNDETGYATNTRFKRFVGRLAVNASPTTWFKTGFNVSGTYAKSSAAAESGIVNPFSFSRDMGPIYPVFAHDTATGAFLRDLNGDKIYDLGNNGRNGNRPVNLGRHGIYENQLNETKYTRSVLSARTYADVIFTPWLKFTTNVTFDLQDQLDLSYDNKIVGDGAPGGRASRTDARTTSSTFNQLLNFNKSLTPEHNLNVLLGHESYDFTYNYLYGFRLQQNVDGISELDNFVTTSSLSSRTDKYRLESYFGKLAYDFQGKYFLTASLRRDGNSRFAKDYRWDNFWSVGAAYRLDKEGFIRQVPFIQELKLRASYGRVGNDAGIGYFPYQGLYALATNNAGEPGTYQSELGNAKLQWEGSKSMDIGLDFAVLDTRIRGTVEWFNRLSDDLILNVGQPLSNGGTTTGALTVYTNVGSLYNRGIEVQLAGDVVRTKDFNYTLTVNATSFKNKVTKMDPVQSEIISGNQKISEGHSRYEYWLREYAGVDPNDGMALYKNVISYSTANSRIIGKDTFTTVISNAQQKYQGKTSIPDVYGSIQNTFSYKNFSLNVSLVYGLGGWAYDNGYASLMHAGTYGYALHKDALKSWKQAGDETNVPRMESNNNPNFAGASTRWLVKASYLNINNASLSYDLPRSLLNKITATAAKVYISGENLGMFTKRKGMNPNAAFDGGNSAGYPPVRIFSGGINLTF